MKVEVTRKTERMCKDLIGEAYEAAHNRFPDFAGFGGLNALWEKIEDTLKVDITTTSDEDSRAMGIMSEVFEEACQMSVEDGLPLRFPSEYVDYKRLWERLCEVLGVKV